MCIKVSRRCGRLALSFGEINQRVLLCTPLMCFFPLSALFYPPRAGERRAENLYADEYICDEEI